MTPVLFAAACGGGPGTGTGADARPPGADAPTGPRDTFQDCRGRAFTPDPIEPWRHDIATPITTAAGDPDHSTQDPIEPSGDGLAVHGQFSYGLISKDLEDELVRVWIDDCAGWVALGDALTDADGRIAVTIPAGTLTGPGVFEARFQVLGDQSMTRAFVWILPAGTHLAISDLDGTLTTSDTQLFMQLLDGSYVPAAYPSAVELTAAHAALGHVVVYLTGRPYYLMQRSRAWLDGLAFADGPVHLADSTAEALPTEGGVGDFKLGYLASLAAKGYVLDLAYGNASTDIYAYLGAGLAADHVWIIGTNGGDQGTNAIVDSWAARAAEVAASPAIVQPFDW